jgi:hypothetical protein
LVKTAASAASETDLRRKVCVLHHRHRPSP